MGDAFILLGFAIIGIFGIAVAILVRIGVIQKWPRRYFAASNAPASVRNGFAGLLPLSIAIFLFLTIVPAARLPVAAPYAILLLLITALALMALAAWWIHRPPEFLKPHWMRALEDSGSNPEASTIPQSRRMYVEVSPLYYAISWIILLVGFLAWVLLNGPPSILIGFGIGLAYLVALRPRRSRHS